MPPLTGRLLIGLLIPMLWSLPLQAGDRGEYEVKAAFLVNFTHFVEWPSSSPNEPFRVCVIGPDPFAGALDKVVGHRTLNDRPIVVKHFPHSVEGTTCEIAFIGDLERGALHKLIPRLELNHSLTVGDSPGFAEQYGIIGFTMEDDRVGLALNPGRAMKAGLKINSQLMRVAKIVSPAPGEGQP